MSGEHGDGRARGELLPLHVLARGHRRVRARSSTLFDPTNLLNPGVLVDPAPVDADLRVPAAQPLTHGLGFAYPHDGGDLSTAVHRCVGVGKCRADTTASGGVMCPSYLATRDEKDSTRGRARVLQELANGSLVEGLSRRRGLHESLDLCLSCKGCSSDCPAGVDMATYKAEVLHQRYRRRLRPAVALRAGLAAALGPARRARAAAGQRDAARDRALGRHGQARSAASTRGARCRTFAAADVPRVVRRPPGRTGDRRCCCGSTRSPTTSRPRSGRPRCAVLEHAGYAVRITDKPVCCGLTWISTGQLDGARRQLRRTPRRAGSGAAHRASRSSGSSRRARRCCAATSPSCCPTTRGAAEVAAATRTLAELLHRHAGLGAARPGRRHARSPSRTATSTRSWAGRPTPTLLRRRRREVDAGRRLLRAGRQLRRRARPLRGVGGGRRDRAAARGARRAARRGRARRRLLLPHPARAARRRAQPAPRRAARRPLHRREQRADPRQRIRDERSGFVPPPYPYDRLDEITALAAQARRRRGRPVDRHAVRPAAGRGARRARRPATPRAATRPRSARPAFRDGGRPAGSSAASARSVDPATEVAALRRHQGVRRVDPAVPEAARPVARHRALPGDQLPDLRDGRDARRLPRRAVPAARPTSPTATPPARCACG